MKLQRKNSNGLIDKLYVGRQESLKARYLAFEVCGWVVLLGGVVFCKISLAAVEQ